MQGAEPLFFLDYFATGKLDPAQGARLVAGIAAGCREAGCALIGGETAEMPGLYHGRDYDLAGFAVGACERGALLPRSDVTPGDVVLGLASSGLHSNGFSLVRRIVAQSRLGWSELAPFASGQSLAEALLTPTRIYVKTVLAVLRNNEVGAGVEALAHITGGGFPENIPRILPKRLGVSLDLSTIPVPPVFRWLAANGPVAEEEMLRTFNCGIGMVVIAARQSSDPIQRAFEAQGEHVSRLGEVIEVAHGPRVVYRGRLAL